MTGRPRGRPRKYPLPVSKPIEQVQDEHVDIQNISPRQILFKLKTPFEESTFGGLLTPEQADRTDTTPTTKDQKLFEHSLVAARTMRILEPVKGRKRKIDPAAPMIEQLFFGTHELHPWYSAPLPAELFEGPEPGRLWMCEYCLKYMRARQTAIRHAKKCGGLPPGCEIYRKDNLSVWEVNGRFSREYCQRLCLLAKMFLDHKTLYYDVETFLFYVLVEWRDVGWDVGEGPPRSKAMGHSFVGYFSKEKQSPSEYNLSCIMTLPHHQRRGMGAFLMDFSYLLTRKEGKTGTPEKPLSDLGLVSYVRYWEVVVSEILREVAVTKGDGELSIEEIMARTGMTANDVLGTLEYLEAIAHTNRGFEIRISKKVTALGRKERGPRADPTFLRWVPYTCIR